MPSSYIVLANIFISTLLPSYSSKDDIPRLAVQVPPETLGLGNRTESYFQQQESAIFSSSENLIYKYDQVSFEAELQPFQNGFYKSKCFEVPKNEDNEDRKDKSDFCIFVDPDVNDRKGMVTIATQSILKQSFRLGFDVPEDPTHHRVIKVVNAPEKGGFGAVAAHKLRRGEPVVSERVVALFPTSSENPFWRTPAGQSIRRQAIDHLPIETRAALARLHGTGRTEDEFISGMIQSNMLATNLLGDSAQYGALVLTASRLNHACRPNVVYYVDKHTQVLLMSAIETIEVGEELTISYRLLDMLREARRESLKHEYGFDCTRSHCTMSAELGKLSDQRIIRMQELQSKASSEDAPISADEVAELLTLAEKKIPWMIATAHSIAAGFYTSKRDIQKVKKHFELARSTVLLLGGPNWSQLDDPERLKNAPEH